MVAYLSEIPEGFKFSRRTRTPMPDVKFACHQLSRDGTGRDGSSCVLLQMLRGAFDDLYLSKCLGLVKLRPYIGVVASWCVCPCVQVLFCLP